MRLVMLEAHLGAAGAHRRQHRVTIHGFVVTFAPAAETVHQLPPK